MSNFICGWYVMYTLAHQEKKVTQLLKKNDIECFLPTTKVVRQWHDRKKIIDTPLFPSYVFVKPKDIKQFYDGQSIDGVSYYVKFGKQFARLEQTVIDQIELAITYGNDLSVTPDEFRPGQRLHINYGPLCGLSCEVISYNGAAKILVRVNLLQRNILISLTPEYLSLINEAVCV